MGECVVFRYAYTYIDICMNFNPKQKISLGPYANSIESELILIIVIRCAVRGHSPNVFQRAGGALDWRPVAGQRVEGSCAVCEV